MQATIIGEKSYAISFIISCFMTLLPGSSYRIRNPDFSMTGFLAFCTLVNKFTLSEQNHPDEGRDLKQSGDTSWSTSCQACKLCKGKKQVSSSATRTVQVT